MEFAGGFLRGAQHMEPTKHSRFEACNYKCETEKPTRWEFGTTEHFHQPHPSPPIRYPMPNFPPVRID